jgi:hypothetical protein
MKAADNFDQPSPELCSGVQQLNTDIGNINVNFTSTVFQQMNSKKSPGGLG